MSDATRSMLLMATLAKCGVLFVTGYHLQIDPRHIVAACAAIMGAGVFCASLEWE